MLTTFGEDDYIAKALDVGASRIPARSPATRASSSPGCTPSRTAPPTCRPRSPGGVITQFAGGRTGTRRRRPRPHRGPHRTRAGSARPRRRRTVQRGDRPAAAHRGRHREGVREHHPHPARRAQPRPGRDRRARSRIGSLTRDVSPRVHPGPAPLRRRGRAPSDCQGPRAALGAAPAQAAAPPSARAARPLLRVQRLRRALPRPARPGRRVRQGRRLRRGLAALGFGHVEVGTVTAHAQPGNPRPRLFRLVADRAIVNRMGFNNAGRERRRRAALRRTRGVPVVVGVNIGKTKVVPESEAVADYVASAKELAPLADYLVVNVSSPNTPGLRDLQAVALLRPLLAGGQGGRRRHPAPHPAAGQDRSGPGRRGRRRGRRPGAGARARRHHRDQHHDHRRRRPRPRPAGCPAARSRPARSRCCAGCAPGSATGSCWSRSAASRTSTTSGSACSPAPRWSRATPAGSTAGRSGPPASTAQLARRVRRHGVSTITESSAARHSHDTHPA